MKCFIAWILFTFATVNILATSATYAMGHFESLGINTFKLFLIGASLAGWETLRKQSKKVNE